MCIIDVVTHLLRRKHRDPHAVDFYKITAVTTKTRFAFVIHVRSLVKTAFACHRIHSRNTHLS